MYVSYFSDRKVVDYLFPRVTYFVCTSYFMSSATKIIASFLKIQRQAALPKDRPRQDKAFSSRKSRFRLAVERKNHSISSSSTQGPQGRVSCSNKPLYPCSTCSCSRRILVTTFFDLRTTNRDVFPFLYGYIRFTRKYVSLGSYSIFLEELPALFFQIRIL